MRDPKPIAHSTFGLSLAVVGDKVLVGSNQNKAYLFDASTGRLLQTLRNPGYGSNFGLAVAAMENDALVSAPWNKGKTGAVYLFRAGDRQSD